MNTLNKIQKIGVLFNGFIIALLTGFYNPFGDYCQLVDKRINQYIAVNCDSMFTWINTAEKYWSFVLPLLLFCGLWLYLFKDKNESPKEVE